MKHADLISRSNARSRLLQQVFGLTLTVLLLTGCGGAPFQTTATPSQIPSTATLTPIPPTVTPTAKPVVTIIGRLLYADSKEPVADNMLMISGEDGAIIISDGILENPDGRTDSTGRFEIEIPEPYLMEQNYKVMVIVFLYSPLDFSNKPYALTDQDGIPIVIQTESVPSKIDLGDVYVYN